MQRHTIAAALLPFFFVACAPSIDLREDTQTTSVRSEKPSMQQAADRAQATLDEFLAKAKQLPAGTKSYAVKVGIREGHDTEYFWVDEFRWTDATFTGRINDEPRLIKRITPGQLYTFSRSDIVDWRYTDETSGKTFGNFTASRL